VELERRKAAVPKYHFTGSQVKPPHPTKSVIVDFLHLVVPLEQET